MMLVIATASWTANYVTMRNDDTIRSITATMKRSDNDERCTMNDLPHCTKDLCQGNLALADPENQQLTDN